MIKEHSNILKGLCYWESFLVCLKVEKALEDMQPFQVSHGMKCISLPCWWQGILYLYHGVLYMIHQCKSEQKTRNFSVWPSHDHQQKELSHYLNFPLEECIHL